MITSPLVLDTCVILSLYATRQMDEILRANGGPFLIAEAVAREALYVHVLVDGVREKEPIDLEPFLESGILRVIAPESEAEFEELVGFSLMLDEGEAMTCALAVRRGYRIATDEKKTINLVGTRVTIVGTLDMVRIWEDMSAVPRPHMREALAAIEDRGYVPGPNHRHYAWWWQRR